MKSAATLLLLAAPGIALGAVAAWALGAGPLVASALIGTLGVVSALMGVAMAIGGANRRW